MTTSTTANREWASLRVAIIGLAATGLATARVLRDLGAVVTVYDDKPAGDLSHDRVYEARQLNGVTLALGQPVAGAIGWEAVDLVIPSPGVPRGAAALTEAVRRGVPVLSEIEIAYRLAAAPILAITGTNGKTTTVALLGAICRAGGLPTWVAGNIAEDAGVRTPLIEAAILAPANGVIVAEISSFQLEWVEQFRPRVGAWLNLSDDHGDRYPTRDEYARAKAALFAAQEEGDFAVINADDADVMRYTSGVGGGERILFGLSRGVWREAHGGACAYLDGPNLVAERIGTDAFEPHFLLSRHDIHVPGLHNVANVLAASAMALAFGVDIGAIRAGVRAFRGVAHRMEAVATVGGVRYINNSMCTNPAAVRASLGAITGPLVAIVGGRHKGGDLTEMVAALCQRADHLVLIGEAAPEIARLIRMQGRGAPPFEIAAPNNAPLGLTHATQMAARAARPGANVVLIPGCASFDMFRGFEHRGQVFRDAVHTLATDEGF